VGIACNKLAKVAVCVKLTPVIAEDTDGFLKMSRQLYHHYQVLSGSLLMSSFNDIFEPSLLPFLPQFTLSFLIKILKCKCEINCLTTRQFSFSNLYKVSARAT
jgi:hypothetical protein